MAGFGVTCRSHDRRVRVHLTVWTEPIGLTPPPPFPVPHWWINKSDFWSLWSIRSTSKGAGMGNDDNNDYLIKPFKGNEGLGIRVTSHTLMNHTRHSNLLTCETPGWQFYLGQGQESNPESAAQSECSSLSSIVSESLMINHYNV